MHIAYLIPTLDRIGGAERQLMQLATGMARRHWCVTVIALSGHSSNAAEELSANNVSYLSLEMHHGIADPRGWNRLRRWVNVARPDILHAHLPHASLMARCIRLVAPVRVVIDTIHSPSTGGFTRQLGYRLTSRLTNLVTAVSRAAAAPWLDTGTINDSHLTIMPNGIDTAYWHRNYRPETETQSTRERPFHWLAVGRLDPVKDYANLLHAFAMLPESARLTIAGTGPLEATLHSLASDLGIDDRITFAGFQTDIRRWMNQVDGFVLSSRWEGLPIALMEASACELPAVFTATGGARELLPDSHSSHVPVGKTPHLAAAMQKMMHQSEAARRKLGLAARLRIVESYNLDSVLSRLDNLYHYVLAVNPQPLRRRRSQPLPAPACSSTTETGTY
ncbi:MAG TPA: glycosyltransferase [Terracidiphilus sp.]|jgi:glycosyltransferase involved in cell wall biosynthesis|nr:glycosyltransferase [Terracidiphilus sp.]